MTKCSDCGSTDMPLDVVLTGEQYRVICPEGGILCANCIVNRASKLVGVVSTCLHIDFACDFEGNKPGSRIWQMMKSFDSCVEVTA